MFKVVISMQFEYQKFSFDYYYNEITLVTGILIVLCCGLGIEGRASYIIFNLFNFILKVTMLFYFLPSFLSTLRMSVSVCVSMCVRTCVCSKFLT